MSTLLVSGKLSVLHWFANILQLPHSHPICQPVIVSFPLDDEAGVSMIAWTTTPWTLPSNLALCVNAAMDYVKIKHKKDGKVYIMMEARLGALFKKEKEYEVMAK